MDLTEGRSTGVPTIQEKLAGNGSPRASFETTEERLTFLIHIPIHSSCDNKLLQLDTQGHANISEEGENSSQKSLQKTFSLILSNPNITAQQIADEIGITRVGVAKQLKKLQEQGIIRRVGPNKGGHWEIVDDGSQDKN